MRLMPSRVTVQRYKCFHQDATLELRPLTLLYGENNSGKSALLRVLRVLADSTRRDLPPGLDLGSEALRGAGFRDLLWRGVLRDAPQRFDLALGWDQPDAALRTLHLGLHEDPGPEGRGAILVHTLEAEDRAGSTLRLEQLPAPPTRNEAPRPYTFALGAATGQVEIAFQGLLPEAAPASVDADAPAAQVRRSLEAIRQLLGGLSGRVDWLRAVRPPPPRWTPVQRQRQQRLDSDGNNAADLLEADAELLAACNRFFEVHLGRRLDTRRLDLPTGRVFRTLLGPTVDAPDPTDIDLIDSGEGPIHLLPVLVALERFQRRNGHAPPLALLLEEPEAHLHPSLQRHLAEHIGAQVKALDPEQRLVIETHSEHVLMGIRLLIARGQLRPDEVALHWVGQANPEESLVARTEIDAQGELLRNWPPGIFGDLDEVGRELMQAQWSRRQG